MPPARCPGGAAADLMLDPHLQAGFLPALAGCGLCEVSPVSTVPPGNAHGGTPSRRRPANTPAGPVTIASATNGPACSRGSGSRAASTWSDMFRMLPDSHSLRDRLLTSAPTGKGEYFGMTVDAGAGLVTHGGGA